MALGFPHACLLIRCAQPVSPRAPCLDRREHAGSELQPGRKTLHCESTVEAPRFPCNECLLAEKGNKGNGGEQIIAFTAYKGAGLLRMGAAIACLCF